MPRETALERERREHATTRQQLEDERTRTAFLERALRESQNNERRLQDVSVTYAKKAVELVEEQVKARLREAT